MIDYVPVVAAESARFANVVQHGDVSLNVPSCPDWNLADLIWHLTEVQDFWGGIVDGLLSDPDDVVTVERPVDRDLAELLVDRSARLVRALAERSPEEVCWSWNPRGHNVGWIRRRQAHEALIHRVDAELATGSLTGLDPELAADGVDEMLTNQIDSPMPEWGRFVSDGAVALIRTTDVAGAWGVEFGRFQGTSPDSGNTHDLDTVALIDPPARPMAEVSGSAEHMDLWLWGRGSRDDLSVEGDPALIDRLRVVAAESTG